MSPSTPPDHPLDDELISAAFDHEVPEEERALVLDNPIARARLERFRLVAQQIAAPVTPAEPEARERIIRDVLDAWRTPEPDASADRDVAPVVPMSPFAPRPRRALAVAAAVAAAVVIPLAALAVIRATQSPDLHSDTATSADAAGSESERVDEIGAALGPSGSSRSEEGASDTDMSAEQRLLSVPAPIDLGVIADPVELRRAVRAARQDQEAAPTTALDEAPAGAPEAVMGASPCAAASAAAAKPVAGPRVLTATATYRGVPVHIDVYEGSQGSPEVAVVTAVVTGVSGCEVLERLTL